MVNWKTISSKVNDETYGAMKVICDKDKIKPNEFIRNAVEKRVNSILNKDLNPDVFPNIGNNLFEYDPETETFSWKINLGLEKPAIISENLSFSFLENIQKSISDALSKKIKLDKKVKKNQAYIPKSIIKLREK